MQPAQLPIKHLPQGGGTASATLTSQTNVCEQAYPPET